MAANARDPQNKAILQELATRWRRLAEETKTGALKPVGGTLTRRPIASA